MTQSGTVLREMLTEAAFNHTNFLFIFSHFCGKILVLIFNMFFYAKVGHSKLVEMHGRFRFLSIRIPVRFVFYTRNWVKIAIYFYNCYIQTVAIENILWTTVFYSIVEIWQIIITAFTCFSFWLTVLILLYVCNTNSFPSYI